MKEFVINKNDSGQRLDRFLTKQGLTVGVIRKALRRKDIKINGNRPQADYRLVEGDLLRVYLPVRAKEVPDFDGVPTVLNIVYEDADIIIADKPPGLLCHDDGGGSPDSCSVADTLINRVKAYLYAKGEFTPGSEHSFEPALCNRIDRNTAGIVIAAKTAESLRHINAKIKSREITKLYLCILCGIPNRQAATMSALLEKDEGTNTVRIRDNRIIETNGEFATAEHELSPKDGRIPPTARTIITQYRVLETRGDFALAEVNLITGRTHQIRAHMAHIGCPILGDGKYGRNTFNKKYGFANKQALCSYKLILDGKTHEVAKVWFLEKFRDF
jgi:23S rRNA pseudouridine955/2504/2580 synthase